MIIKRDSYVLYHTSESEGLDICIKDDINRFTLIPVDDIPALIQDLQEIMLERSETESVNRNVKVVKENW